jgi:hypothetical protein
MGLPRRPCPAAAVRCRPAHHRQAPAALPQRRGRDQAAGIRHVTPRHAPPPSTKPPTMLYSSAVRRRAALLASRLERKLLANVPAVVEDGVAAVSAAVVEWAAPKGAVVTDPSASQDAPSGNSCHLYGFVVNPPITHCDPVVVRSWLIEGSFGGECRQSSSVHCLPPSKPGMLVSFGLPCQSKLITVHCAARTYSPNRCRRSC